MRVIILITALVLVGCQTTKQTEKIVVSDTTRFVIIDTTHVVIKDTLHVINTINEVVFDTLYNFVDSVIVREVVKNANENIRTTFNYDTNLVLKDNKLLALKLHYDGDSLQIDYDLKQLIEGEVRRERVEREQVEEWLPSKWVQILIGAFVFLLILFAVAWRFSKK